MGVAEQIIIADELDEVHICDISLLPFTATLLYFCVLHAYFVVLRYTQATRRPLGYTNVVQVCSFEITLVKFDKELGYVIEQVGSMNNERKSSLETKAKVKFFLCDENVQGRQTLRIHNYI